MNKIDFKKMGGLIPTIIQNADSKQVLMLGYMNEDALQMTLETKRVTFWSRSRSSLWIKGETSGNFLELTSINTDCDGDVLLIEVKPNGPTCHTGQWSCFEERSDSDILEVLFKLIQSRKEELPEGSYTTSLFQEGLPKISEKVMEEAEEVCRAAREETKERTAEEAADVLYHLFVLLVANDVGFDKVKKVLNLRNKKAALSTL